MESPVFGYLVVLAFVLLLLVSGGIAYLTVIEWRDRRRRKQDGQDERSSRRPGKVR